MAAVGGDTSRPRDAWLKLKRTIRRVYVFCGTVALIICVGAVVSGHMGWLNVGWRAPSAAALVGLFWGAVTWLALNSGEVIRVVSFGLLAWALFRAAMRMEMIFEIVRGFNEARSPISQLHSSVVDIKSTIRSVAATVDQLSRNH